jgi:hypothetical protein
MALSSSDHRMGAGMRPPLPGPARGSCAWRDAVGPGFATGLTNRLLNLAAQADSVGYRL